MFGAEINILMKQNQLFLLNSHHDTVKPNQAYTQDPFYAILKKMENYMAWEVMMQADVWFH